MELYTDLNLMKYLERAGSKKAEKQLWYHFPEERGKWFLRYESQFKGKIGKGFIREPLQWVK